MIFSFSGFFSFIVCIKKCLMQSPMARLLVLDSKKSQWIWKRSTKAYEYQDKLMWCFISLDSFHSLFVLRMSDVVLWSQTQRSLNEYARLHPKHIITEWQFRYINSNMSIKRIIAFNHWDDGYNESTNVSRMIWYT